MKKVKEDWHTKCKWFKSPNEMDDKKSACLAHLHEDECNICWPKNEKIALEACMDYKIQLRQAKL